MSIQIKKAGTKTKRIRILNNRIDKRKIKTKLILCERYGKFVKKMLYVCEWYFLFGSCTFSYLRLSYIQSMS